MSRIALGRVLGSFGIQGWVRIQSYSRPPEGLLKYRRWHLGTRTWDVIEGRAQGTSVVARLEGLSVREDAMALRGLEVEVERAELPPAGPGEYYWMDLVGCAVRSVSGAALGQVDSLITNGAQDILVVRGDRERLIPFVPEIVRQVDVKAKQIVMDWEPEY